MRMYYQYLTECIERFGYSGLRYQNRIFLAKQQQEDKILLLRILDEPLLGQNPIDLSEEHEIMETVGQNLMVNHHCMVETLMIVLTSTKPDEDLGDQINEYNDIWAIHVGSGRLFIYENQKADFYGLKDEVELVACLWPELEKIDKEETLKKNLTPMNTLMIVVNLLVFLILSVLGNTEDGYFIAQHGGMVYSFVTEGHEWYRLFTSMFVHFGFKHVAENMFTLFLVGQILERNVGKVRYLIIYLGAGLTSSLTSLWFNLSYDPYTVSGGASGAVCGVLGGLFFLIIYNMLVNRENNVEGISLRGVIFIILFSVGYGFTVSGVDNAAHIGGVIGGFVLTGLLTAVRALFEGGLGDR